MELLEIADRLYGLPMADFTPARDAQAKELKGTDLAAPVKALKKPSLAAWVVNLFVRREGDQVEQVLALGDSLREAQAAMSASELRELTKQRRQLTAAVTTQARALAREEGVRVTEAVAEQVEATLTAALVDPECGRAVRSGLLVSALASTGVDAVDLTGAVALPEALGFTATAHEPEPTKRPDLHVVPDPDADAKAIKAAEATLAGAEEELAEATSAQAEAADVVERAEAQALQLQSEVEEVKRRLAELEEQLEETDDEIAEAEDARSDADDVVREAEKAVAAAKKALARLAGK